MHRLWIAECANLYVNSNVCCFVTQRAIEQIVNSHKYWFKNYVCRAENWCVILAVTIQSAYSSVLSQYVPCSLQHLETNIFLVNSERLSHDTLSFIHKCLTILSGSLSLFRRCTQQKQNKNVAEPNLMLNKSPISSPPTSQRKKRYTYCSDDAWLISG